MLDVFKDGGERLALPTPDADPRRGATHFSSDPEPNRPPMLRHPTRSSRETSYRAPRPLPAMNDDPITLFRPVGPAELALLWEAAWRAWPPRLPGQPIFYPVLTEAYARQIARDWNVKESGSGFVTRFRVRRSFVERYEVHVVGSREHQELWIPAGDVLELNANLVGAIELIASYP